MKQVLFILSIVVGISCNNHVDVNEWYDKTKKSILDQSSLTFDKIDSSNKAPNRFYYIDYYYREHIFKEIGFNPDGQRVEKLFSSDDNFTLTKEFCENGQLRFEGLSIKKIGFVGPSTWWHCNGKISESGIRYGIKNIGHWTKFNENGNLISDSNYNNLELLSEMISYKNYR